MIDYGVDNGLISADDSKAKLAIVQRFSSNPVFKNMLGLTGSSSGFSSTIPKEDFDKLLGQLFEDIVGKEFKAHQFNKTRVESYVNDDLAKVGVSGQRQDPEVLFGSGGRSASGTKPTKPKVLTKISHSLKLEDGLSKLGNYKLQKLYYSLTKVSAKDHCPLMYVGFWSLVECLTALDGRDPKTSFTSYLSALRLAEMGFGNKDKTKFLRTALGRVAEFGNGTKHDGEAAGFAYEQLINDSKVIEKLLVELVNRVTEASDR
ncbi:hypothetical protein MWU60_14075 [Yoonia sp. F2084L]|nr:hypothetical protein [Yoonia sp. F2084L]